MSNIIDLRETSPNHWQAKYQGNYGVYTIKINTGGKGGNSFSCTCPSSYHPCKHIAMVESAIAERIAKSAENRNDGEATRLSVEKLLGKLTHKELYNFMVRIARNNPDLTNAVFLEFAEKIEDGSGNKYVSIIRKGLENTELDEDAFYDGEDVNYIDVLDEWNEKARQFLEEKKNREAALIAQAWIEEYADWLNETVGDDDLIDLIDETYQSRPFKILEEAAADPNTDIKALYDYCMTEAAKEKYAGLEMADHFYDLLATLAEAVNPEAFIDLQQKLLDQVQDKSSYKAKKILDRIIEFYKKLDNPEKAWSYVEDNIQIKTFRSMVVEKRIEQKKYAEAKKLIHDYIDTNQNRRRPDDWDEYLLQIAQKENDIPTIRSISFSFIKDNFNKQYYEIYKLAFGAGEWEEEFEKLFRHYEAKQNSWHDSAANLLAAEGKAERLLDYIEEKLSLEKMEKYHTFFAGAFPERTLALFREVLDDYAEKNTGRSYYERIIAVLKMMRKIPGGDAVAADMKGRYRIIYKNRRAMVEILNRE
ncbi:MAG: SWIM zinc finger family protein [Spirochaetaceae bacterium]|jgi:hypothetical protein|nr:SWIM zinc finger family protein [Spirochaetaceae bacterium]